ncbi:MAG: flagellar biosynthesis protein FliQ [Succinivibrio dextrinosolvens]|uniref:Flagellar biosynthetic protein FliQ n=1 Tax=Succinivibrio dextrinosolvens TaxID=83771 RepID=A0A662ZF07_9GAMM|nr:MULTISPECIES: flagellar biosynthesis protein FliQ [Succinivibrio]MBQ9219959.1 flagellar biosynthesis protein FliQ [Succinivibrio sp.]MDY6415668.1 flagellar biosynthesis protein FliQ [Succinivibrio dextrinosolvens]MDY6420024.1 flagellar biosynthesis protein FliQ [Succinivibrio dextrinosolvens]MDY6466474.1 flagellar biosynthesis protein FliQ [Succinivibrio dextrinosolvens]MDY6470121.1 flagellar biosynthesis protein FliQ [Succinivibrio dextrinosolvens]
MEAEVFVDIVREALGLVAILVSASIIPSLCVGLIVSVFQAATSINEQTLSFLPRLVVTVGALIFGAHWGLEKLMSFFRLIIDLIPQSIG